LEIPFHRTLLLANHHETASLTRLDYETILGAAPETVLKIPFTYPEFSALKLYLYTNQVDLTMDNVWKLLELSLRTDSRDNLSRICEKFIWKNWTVWGVYKILENAERVGSKDLKNWAVWSLCLDFASSINYPNFYTLSKETQDLIIEGQWPGEEYLKKQKEWLVEKDKATKKLYSDNSSNNCLVQ